MKQSVGCLKIAGLSILGFFLFFAIIGVLCQSWKNQPLGPSPQAVNARTPIPTPYEFVMKNGPAFKAQSDRLEDHVRQIMGTPKNNNDSGLIYIDSIYPAAVTNITYRWMPVVSSSATAFGHQLADKIHNLYTKGPTELDIIQFTILLPHDDEFGNRTWAPTLTFSTDRELIMKRIDWENFLKSDLANVIPGLKEQF